MNRIILKVSKLLRMLKISRKIERIIYLKYKVQKQYDSNEELRKQYVRMFSYVHYVSRFQFKYIAWFKTKGESMWDLGIKWTNK